MNFRALIRGLAVLVCVALSGAPGAQAKPVTETPLNPNVQIDALSCPGGSSCTAVGTYTDGLGHGQGLLISRTASGWHRGIKAPLPANAGTDPLNLANNTGLTDVSCTAPGNCAAVGIYTDNTNNDRGLLLSERNGKWSRGVEARLPSGALAPAKSKKRAGDAVVVLGDACASAGDCYAVGNYVTNANTLSALIITEQHGKWLRGRPAPLPVGAAVHGQRAVLYAITCLPGGSCSATGSYQDSNGAQQAMILNETNGVWNARTEADLPSSAGVNPVATPIAVNCVAAGACTVVGNYQDVRDNSLGLLLSENSGVWAPGTQVTLPTNAAPPTSYNAQTTEVISVSCSAPGDCAAVGAFTDNNGNTQALLLSEVAEAWQPGQEVVLPSNAITRETSQTAGLDTVSCPSAGNCVAGGLYTDTTQSEDSLLVTETNGVWGPGVEVALPRGASNNQYSAIDAVHCQSVGNCTAIGTYNDHHGDVLGYSVTERDGVWEHAENLTAPSASSQDVRLSVKALLVPAGKEATVAAIARSGGFDQPYALLEAGRLTLSWYADSEGARVLVASATVSNAKPGKGELHLRLTAAGRQLFDAGGHLKLNSVAVFKPAHGARISLSGSFTLN